MTRDGREAAVPCGFESEERPRPGRFAVTTRTSLPAWSALRHALLNRRDRALKVTADGKGLVGHTGAILLRKAADQLGLTAGLSAALLKKGTSPSGGRDGAQPIAPPNPSARRPLLLQPSHSLPARKNAFPFQDRAVHAARPPINRNTKTPAGITRPH
jgi:hypothetical protein